MLDIRRIRANKDEVIAALAKRHNDFKIDELLELDEERRVLLAEIEQQNAEKNKVSKQIPQFKKEGKDVTAIFEEMKKITEEMKEKEDREKELDEEIRTRLLNIPNTPNESVPIGKDDNDNIEVRRVGEPTKFDFEPQAHWDLGVNLDILDWERASKITGARFTLFKKDGAKLERALINFMLNLHTGDQDYIEMSPPFMVNRAAMYGTGQLPKFEDDMFHLPSKDYFLVPTAEVPLTNLLKDEIIPEQELPIYYTAYTPCFRQEAGSAGRDTRGLIRNHQFDKVELVKFVNPEDSYEELEKLTNNAEEVLKQLGLPYRVVALSSGDLGFSSAKTYDIEVWMPSYNRYVEISSCSNFEDFQARRANLRYRRDEDNKVEYLHTLNGSGLAVGRTLAAILENYQNADGSVTIPEALRHYFNGREKLDK
ncbi:MAG: serine--tRNA ligase [Tissierellia bacterium]|nr:serine--tRNA ligase [Tissierellia bacterium]